jgi:hypothetical protein
LVLPTGEYLEACQLASTQSDQRLEEGNEAALLQGTICFLIIGK